MSIRNLAWTSRSATKRRTDSSLLKLLQTLPLRETSNASGYETNRQNLSRIQDRNRSVCYLLPRRHSIGLWEFFQATINTGSSESTDLRARCVSRGGESQLWRCDQQLIDAVSE